MDEPKEIVVEVYLNNARFRRAVQMGEKMGMRRPQVLLFTKKIITTPTGFVEGLKGNTERLSKAFIRAMDYYMEHEAERLAEQARLAQEEKELQEKKKKLGMF